MIFGAHADRLQEGMRRAFGKPIGRAARVEAGQPVMRLLVYEDGVRAGREALEFAGKKLPKKYYIVENLLAQRA
jgi:large subunit ribosomal protein L10e